MYTHRWTVCPGFTLKAPMVTIQIDAGRKQKIRPGDILGRIDRGCRPARVQVGKIAIFDMCSYVAVERAALRQALNYLAAGKVKGRAVRARKINA